MGRWRKNGRFAAVTWVMVTAVLLPHAAAWLGLLFLPPAAAALPGLDAAQDWWGDETAVDPIFLPPPKTPPRPAGPAAILLET